MNSSNGQTERKRKVSPSSSSSSSMDSSDGESTPLRRCVQKNSGKVSRISILNCPDSQKNSSSSETDSEDEKCPICLKVLKNQILAITDTCRHHTFCLPCLEEWSKTKRTCPVDRKKYQSVLVLDSKRKVSKELFLKSLPVASNQSCEICGYLDEQDAMLVCFGCNLAFHSFCVMPHINEPAELWLCNECCYYYNN